MALKEQHPEPSMEEILASIRRIISEDPADQADAPVLELATPAPDPEPEPTPAPALELRVEEPDDDLVFDDEPLLAAAPEPAPAPEPPRAPPPSPGPALTAPAPADAIVSPPAVSAAAGAFTRLVGSLRIADSQGQTVEGVVRELLQPMLKEWLDLHLPAIVEAKVEAELERIARLAR